MGDKDGMPTISWLGYEVKVRRSWCVRVRVRVVARNSIMVFVLSDLCCFGKRWTVFCENFVFGFKFFVSCSVRMYG